MKVSFQGIYDLYNKTVTPNEHGTLAVKSSPDTVGPIYLGTPYDYGL